MKKILLLCLTLVPFIFSCNQSIQYSVEAPGTPNKSVKNESVTRGDGIRQRDGKCFKNCIIPDQYESKWVSFPVYTGSDPDAPIRIETIVEDAPQNKWVKKNTGEVCLVQTPAKTKAVYILADTMFYKDFRFELFETKKLVEKGGFLRETEVICSDERTPNLFLQVSTALKSFGYMEEPKAQWDMKFSQAIQQFQKDNSLPVGDLNLKTLEFLGI